MLPATDHLRILDLAVGPATVAAQLPGTLLGLDLSAAMLRRAAVHHDEIGAWACEIDTWDALVDQDWRRAASLVAAGEALAPSGSPAAAQLAVQAARATARLGDGPEVRAALCRCAAALDRQSQDRPPDHHFFFDGNKFELYTGTALAWLGDPAAEDYAQQAAAQVIAEFSPIRLPVASVMSTKSSRSHPIPSDQL